MDTNKMTDIEKMQAGMLFNQTNLRVLLKMTRGYLLMRKLNRTSMLNQGKRNRIMRKLFGSLAGKTFYVQSPLYVDYGHNIHIGKNFLSNFNLILQDEAEIRIGDNVMIASNVIITTDIHPLLSCERNVCWVPNKFPHNHKGVYVHAKPITIEDNVWICANTTVCAGVTIGKNSVIGAGSIVTRDIPPNVLAYGSPCRVIRELTEADKVANRIFNINTDSD